MYSNRIPTSLVTVLALLAGCAGGADVVSAADASNTDISTGGGDSADIGVSSDDDDFELSGSERLPHNAGSFTVSWLYTGVETAVTRKFAVDLSAERPYSRTTSTTDGQSDADDAEQYVVDDMAYVRVGGDDGATHTPYEGSTEVLAAVIVLSQAHTYGADDDLTFAGTETFDGMSVKRYELSAAGETLILAGSAAAQDESETLEVTSFEYVVLVNENGPSRRKSWLFSGRMDDGSEVSEPWEYSPTGVGSTTVEEPVWLGEARAQSTDLGSESWFSMRSPGFEPRSPAHFVYVAHGNGDSSLFNRARTTPE